MASIGYRQKGDSGPLYNPERDYAYITPTLMVRAIENLDEAARTEEAKQWYADENVSQDEIVAVASALAKAQKDFVNGGDPVQSFEQALNRHGFFNFRYAVRQALFSSIGEVFCAAWFSAVREVSVMGEDSPVAAGMARFTAIVNEFAKRANAPTYNADITAALMQLRNDVLQTRLNLVYKELQAAQEKLDEAVAKEKLATAALAAKKSWWQRFVDWSSEKTDYTGPK
jgi:hypothetical protein